MTAAKTVALVICGSVAAFKAVQLARELQRQGFKVLPVLTRSGGKFVGALSLSALTGRAVAEDMWDAGHGGELHVELAAEADLVLVAPATADFLARAAHGRADDLAAALVLSARGAVWMAPAMHPRMWAHPATARNVAQLKADGVRFVGPEFGEVASGEHGLGRMSEPEAIAREVSEALRGPLHGTRVLVSAGPTHEPIDPVRFVGNRSSGKMGFAIAAEAAARGAEVVLVAGPVALATPAGVRRLDVQTAQEMHDALHAELGACDAVVMSAAVADYRPESAAAHKLKREGRGEMALSLVQNPDILASLSRARGASARPLLVGFALETGSDAEVIGYAQGKLARKGVDLVVANHASESLGREDNRVHLVSAEGVRSLPTLSKRELARELVDELSRRLG